MRWLVLILLFTGCIGSTPGPCNWSWCLPEGAQWLHDPASEYHDTYAATLADWRAAGLPEPAVRRVSLTLTDGPAAPGAHAFVATSTRKHVGIVVRRDRGDRVTRRLIRHELVHAFGARAGLGLDRGHADRRRCPVDDDWCADD